MFFYFGGHLAINQNMFSEMCLARENLMEEKKSCLKKMQVVIDWISEWTVDQLANIYCVYSEYNILVKIDIERSMFFLGSNSLTSACFC